MSDAARLDSTRHRGDLSRAWYAVLAAVVLASLVTQIVLVVRSGTDVNSNVSDQAVGMGIRLGRLFSYFTIQSNLLVLAAAITLALNPRRDGRFWRVLHLDALLGITITGLVFGAILAGQVHHQGVAAWVNAGLHYFAPAWAVVGWLLFGPRPRIDWPTVAWAFVWPVLWIVYTFGHGAATGWYPYPFLDAHTHGYAVALRNTLAVVVLGLVLAVVFKWLDRRLPTIRR